MATIPIVVAATTAAIAAYGARASSFKPATPEALQHAAAIAAKDAEIARLIRERREAVRLEAPAPTAPPALGPSPPQAPAGPVDTSQTEELFQRAPYPVVQRASEKVLSGLETDDARISSLVRVPDRPRPTLNQMFTDITDYERAYPKRTPAEIEATAWRKAEAYSDALQAAAAAPPAVEPAAPAAAPEAVAAPPAAEPEPAAAPLAIRAPVVPESPDGAAPELGPGAVAAAAAAAAAGPEPEKRLAVETPVEVAPELGPAAAAAPGSAPQEPPSPITRVKGPPLPAGKVPLFPMMTRESAERSRASQPQEEEEEQSAAPPAQAAAAAQPDAAVTPTTPLSPATSTKSDANSEPTAVKQDTGAGVGPEGWFEAPLKGGRQFATIAKLGYPGFVELWARSLQDAKVEVDNETKQNEIARRLAPKLAQSLTKALNRVMKDRDGLETRVSALPQPLPEPVTMARDALEVLINNATMGSVPLGQAATAEELERAIQLASTGAPMAGGAPDKSFERSLVRRVEEIGERLTAALAAYTEAVDAVAPRPSFRDRLFGSSPSGAPAAPSGFSVGQPSAAAAAPLAAAAPVVPAVEPAPAAPVAAPVVPAAAPVVPAAAPAAAALPEIQQQLEDSKVKGQAVVGNAQKRGVNLYTDAPSRAYAYKIASLNRKLEGKSGTPTVAEIEGVLNTLSAGTGQAVAKEPQPTDLTQLPKTAEERASILAAATAEKVKALTELRANPTNAILNMRAKQRIQEERYAKGSLDRAQGTQEIADSATAEAMKQVQGVRSVGKTLSRTLRNRSNSPSPPGGPVTVFDLQNLPTVPKVSSLKSEGVPVEATENKGEFSVSNPLNLGAPLPGARGILGSLGTPGLQALASKATTAVSQVPHSTAKTVRRRTNLNLDGGRKRTVRKRTLRTHREVNKRKNVRGSRRR